ncbi:hypothetical protein H3J60_004559 [Salmonella enterica]|nr:hypothetical protein [Salmonella enterica]
MILLIMPFVLWFVAFIYGAYSLTLLWSWFIVPFGIADITFPWAIGLFCIVSLVKGISLSDKESEIWSLLAKNFALISLTVVFGFIAHKFM